MMKQNHQKHLPNSLRNKFQTASILSEIKSERGSAQPQLVVVLEHNGIARTQWGAVVERVILALAVREGVDKVAAAISTDVDPCVAAAHGAVGRFDGDRGLSSAGFTPDDVRAFAERKDLFGRIKSGKDSDPPLPLFNRPKKDGFGAAVSSSLG